VNQPNKIDQRLAQFCQLADDDALSAFLQEHQPVLLTEAEKG